MKCKMETSVISDSMCKCSMDENENNRIDPVKTGEFIKKLRKSHKLTQEELGAKLFITRKAVSKWENGVCCPSLDLLKRLSVLLDVSIEELTNGEFSSSPLRHSRIGKIFRNKHIMRISITIIALLFLLLFLFFIFNFNKTRCYSMNYESESFSMTNGQLFISNNDNYISLGDFVTNFTDVDENTKYEFTIVIIDKNKSKELFTIRKTETKHLDNSVVDKFKKNLDKFAIKVNYKNIRGEDVNFMFRPKIILTEKSKINEVKNKNSLSKYSNNMSSNLTDSTDNHTDTKNLDIYSESIDISFLYEKTFNELSKKLNGVTISYENTNFKIKVDVNNNTIYIDSDKYTILLNLDSDRIIVTTDTLTNFSIINKRINLLNDNLKVNLLLSDILFKVERLL